MVVEVDGNSFEVCWIEVPRDKRNQRISEKLLNNLFDFMEKHGITEVNAYDASGVFWERISQKYENVNFINCLDFCITQRG